MNFDEYLAGRGISRNLNEAVKLKAGDLEYIDEVTLLRALQGRTEI